MQAGDMLAGRYRLDEPLGSGGFSEVWRALDKDTGLDVAVKLPRAGREAEANAKLREEAAILGGIDHQNIVRVLGTGTDSGREYLVLELLIGRTLRETLRESGPMTDGDVLALGIALADALEAAHDRGLVHGDIKPENIVLVDEVPRIIDFGTARNFADTLAPEELQQISGTLAYLAPEVLIGEPLTPQSDIYALGVTLYEARAGRLPFAGVASVLSASEGRTPSLLRSGAPGVDARLESAIMQSLASDPTWRPRSAGEIRARLETGRQETIRLRPQRSENSGPAKLPRDPLPMPMAFTSRATINRVPDGDPAQSSRAAFPNFDEWVASQHRSRTMPRAVLIALTLMAVLFLGVVIAPGLVKREPAGSTDASSPEEPSGESIALAPSTPTVTPTETKPATALPTDTATPTATVEPTTEAPIITPEPSPTSVPPTPIPPTPTAGSVQQAQAPLGSATGPATVVRWYGLLTSGEFDEAYALWSYRMKMNFPRQGNLDGRWANTVGVSVNDVRIVSESDSQMVVAIDFVEMLANGTTRRFVGTWQLISSPEGWLLDQPSF